MSVGNVYFEHELQEAGFEKCQLSSHSPAVYRLNRSVYIFKILDHQTGKMRLVTKSTL